MLVDRIIIGVNDKKLQLKLLDTKNEKLIDIIDKCKAFEVANQNKSLLDKNIVHQAVHSVESKECTPSESINAISRRCYNCGSTFGPGHLNECKAKTINCHSCGRRGHFSRFCKQAKTKSDNNRGNDAKFGEAETKQKKEEKKVSSMNWADETGNSSGLNDGYFKKLLSGENSILRISSIGSHSQRWMKEYQIGNQNVAFKIDTGAAVNCIPIRVVQQSNIKIENGGMNFPIYDYNDNKVKVFGTVKLNCFDRKQCLLNTV